MTNGADWQRRTGSNRLKQQVPYRRGSTLSLILVWRPRSVIFSRSSMERMSDSSNRQWAAFDWTSSAGHTDTRIHITHWWWCWLTTDHLIALSQRIGRSVKLPWSITHIHSALLDDDNPLTLSNILKHAFSCPFFPFFHWPLPCKPTRNRAAILMRSSPMSVLSKCLVLDCYSLLYTRQFVKHAAARQMFLQLVLTLPRWHNCPFIKGLFFEFLLLF